MAICKKCGNHYLSNECLYCKNGRKNKTKSIKILSLSLIITLIIFGVLASIGAASYIFYKNKNLEKTISIKDKKIRELDYDNQGLKNQIYKKDELLYRYQKTIKNLNKEIRNLRYKNNYKKDKTVYYKPKKKNHIKTHHTYTKTKPHYNNRKTYRYDNANRNISKRKATKTYHRYRQYEKTISDSEITIRNDGRFKSNSTIYGVYKEIMPNSIKCGGNPDLYQIENECSACVSFICTDKIYFSKSNINELKTLDKRNHKVECHYSQDYGIMEDCRAKIYSYK